MLERLIIRNFKRFEAAEIDLGQTVVFIGPNNAGKTSALQALALWEVGVRRWMEKRTGKEAPKKRTGVAINRRDLVSVPVPDANLLWRDLHLRRVDRSSGRQRTENIRIEIGVSGASDGASWECAFEFDYANSESLYCRPVRDASSPIPEQAGKVRVAYLPPMSGLAANETLLPEGAVHVRIGEGRTAEVLRNLCYDLHENMAHGEGWDPIVEALRGLFGVTLHPPVYVSERGEVTMSFEEGPGTRLDLSASGRGLQQTLLLLAYIHRNPGSVILLDEPDAHLEILRQRQIYQIITTLAESKGCQVVAASHSEVLLNEAAGRDVVVAFVGHPHRIDDRGAQVLKSLRSIGFEHYYQAEQTGWVLYLEGSTDLAILRAFADTLEHPAARCLERPFVEYIGNQPSRAAEHFFGLREAKSDLVGVVVVDRIEQCPTDRDGLRAAMWGRREIENYLCFPEVLEAYAAQMAESSSGPLFAATEKTRLVEVMRRCVADEIPPGALKDRDHAWWSNTKASDDFLDRVFARFFDELEMPNRMLKKDYHELARLVPANLLAGEVREKLDLIAAVARAAGQAPD